MDLTPLGIISDIRFVPSPRVSNMWRCRSLHTLYIVDTHLVHCAQRAVIMLEISSERISEIEVASSHTHVLLSVIN